MKTFKIRKGVYPLVNGTFEVLRDLESQSYLRSSDVLLNGRAPDPGEPIPEEVLYLVLHRFSALNAIVERMARYLNDNFPGVHPEEAEDRAMSMIRECDLMFPLLWEGRKASAFPASSSPRVTIGG